MRECSRTPLRKAAWKMLFWELSSRRIRLYIPYRCFKKSNLNSCEVYKNLIKLKIYLWYSLDSPLLFGIDNLLYITILQQFNWFVDCQSVLHHCYACVDLCKLKRMIVSTVLTIVQSIQIVQSVFVNSHTNFMHYAVSDEVCSNTVELCHKFWWLMKLLCCFSQLKWEKV